MRKFGIHYVAGMALVAAAGGAQALGFAISYSGNESISVTAVGDGASPGTYTGGAFTITPNGLDGAWPAYVPAGSFVSYCTQISESFGSSPLSGYSITTSANPGGQPPVDGAKLDQLSRLMAFSYSGSGFGPTPTNTQEAAIQAAVWEILYEPNGTGWGGFDLGTGSFKAALSIGQSAAFTTISTWVGGGATLAGPYTPYALLTKGGSQDFLVPVPEPEAYGLALAGLGVVAFMLRRRRAAAAAA